ncbi:hypothetical protein [Acinetobacter variabilis]|uniref:hypothetical protein n=1 Tax=Acinetobacter variabilis TaxID=70346 RepID=UPI00289A313E|nr:hypothetical protein [Acinetobacter variabilis]
MIKFITVWVLTVGFWEDGHYKGGPSTYQLQYATKDICEKQKKNHQAVSKYKGFMRCDFQQIPVVVNK